MNDTGLWVITENDENWQDAVEGTIEDAWFNVGETISNVSVVPTEEQLAVEPGDTSNAMWVGSIEHIDANTARVVYWEDMAGEGRPVRHESIITLTQTQPQN